MIFSFLQNIIRVVSLHPAIFLRAVCPIYIVDPRPIIIDGTGGHREISAVADGSRIIVQTAFFYLSGRTIEKAMYQPMCIAIDLAGIQKIGRPWLICRSQNAGQTIFDMTLADLNAIGSIKPQPAICPLHTASFGTAARLPHIGNARTAIEPFTAVIAWCLRRTVCQIHSAIRDHKSPG